MREFDVIRLHLIDQNEEKKTRKSLNTNTSWFIFIYLKIKMSIFYIFNNSRKKIIKLLE